MRMKEIAEYEYATDYVVIPLAMRDRIMARLTAAEARVKELKAENTRLRGGIDMALSELGIPQPGYPAPAAEAVAQLCAALRDAAEREGEGE